MKIYGGRDYYDSIMAWGSDPKTVLTRDPKLTFKAEEVSVGIDLLDISLDGRSSIDSISEPEWIVVVFCSKIYRGLRVRFRCEDLVFWDVYKFQAWADENRIKVKARSTWHNLRRSMKLEECMDVVDASNDLRKFMIENRVAILRRDIVKYQNAVWKVNPSGLKKISFAKAVPPYEAYQELSMWVGGVLGGQSPETVTITDDKVLVENHGFDKHSFRSSERT